MKLVEQITIAVLALGAISSIAAFAGDKKKSDTKTVSYERRTKLDFEAKSVDGEFLKPDGLAVGADKNLDFDSLLQARKNFKKELKRSSGAVR
jgi:hypothetical protein